jgi:hypothetical protein
MVVTQPAMSETHQAEQELLAQRSNGKKILMSRIGSDAICDKLQNRLSGSVPPTVPCILRPFKVHHVLYDWGARMRTHWSLPLISCDWQTPL